MSIKVRIFDDSLRDGVHGMGAGNSPDSDVIAHLAKALDETGVEMLFVGEGLEISSSGKTMDYIKAARPVVKNAKLASNFTHGFGTEEDIEAAVAAGLDVVRVAVLAVTPELGLPYIRKCRELGVETGAFLMHSHMVEPEKLAANAKLLEEAGAQFIYVGDSGGALMAQQLRDRVRAVRKAVSVPLGIHVHNNYGLAVSSTLIGIEEGCEIADGTLNGFGAHGGNANLQAVVAACDKSGIETGVDFRKLNEIADTMFQPIAGRLQTMTSADLVRAYDGVFPDNLKHLLPKE